MLLPTPLLVSSFPGIPKMNQGKVRDLYDVDASRLLFLMTDRISCFDVIMPNGIPEKGRVLTEISMFWFMLLKDLVPNHLLTNEPNVYPTRFREHADLLRGRSMLVKKLKMVPVECIVRGYLAGSGWKEYQQSGTVCGHQLPDGLRESDRLPEPIFTPSTKEESGHDINITRAQCAQAVGKALADELEQKSLDIYLAAANYARSRGIIIADTKLEFGLDEGGNLLLADEVLTPDSSRFWDMETYEPGRAQDSFDKQYVRDYLEQLGWNKKPPAPTLPDEIVAGTTQRYLEAYRRITGTDLAA